MLNLYIAKDKSLQLTPFLEDYTNIENLVWVDLFCPTGEEEKFAEELLKISIPTRDEMHEIELSSRLYQENDALYCTANILTKTDTDAPETHAITFIITKKCLITVRYSDPRAFRLVLSHHDVGHTGNTVFAALFEGVIDRLADILENIGRNIEAMNHSIFLPRMNADERKKSKPDLEEVLRKIAINGDLVSKTRESLIGIMRLMNYISNTSFLKPKSKEIDHIKNMMQDIVALNDHADFLSNKVTFLLDATLGMISIQQNTIIKIFSIATVVSLPPTLVACIYGMNFEHMPELKWVTGYPLAIAMMLVSALLPYWFFRRKGWL
jgi:magnesium transporter